MFDVKYKYDPTLSVDKLYAYYKNNLEYMDAMGYIECMAHAHQQMMQVIYKG